MQFTIKYYDYEIDDLIHFCCPEQALASGFCIFHDKDYLQNKTNNEHKRKVLDRLKYKVNHAISNNEPLLCIGFYLPDFSLSDLSISKKFTIPVYFGESRFFGKGFFIVDKFQRTASSIEPSLPSQPSPLSDFEEFKAIYGLGNRQRDLGW